MNTTTKNIIDRLPSKPILSPSDIAAAYGLATTSAILADIKTGRLAANVVNGRFIISRAAAAEYIEQNEYISDERQ